MGRDERNRKGREGSWNRAADLLRPALVAMHLVVARFGLVPKSMTVVDPELTLNSRYSLCYITHMFFFGAHS